MFTKARLKLTAWYLFIIMFISFSFSAFTYRSVTLEFQRRLNVIERRFDFRGHGFRPPAGQTQFFIQDLKETRQRLLFILIYTNGVILVFSAVAGYFLSGRTLSPIEAALEEQKRFVADASHELRTPLTALKTSLEVALRDKKMSLKQAKEVLGSNLEDIDSLQSLTNNLLSLTHYQDNGRQLVFEEVDLEEIVKKAAKKILPLAKERGIDLKLEIGDHTLQANRESLEEMLLIFLDNAVKYTPKGGQVTLTTKSGKKNLIIEIKDTGIGIAERDLPHIFDRFYRVDQSRSKSKVTGFGLGLALAKRIIEIHRGSVAVSSALNKGTTFTIKLPLKHS